MNAECSAIKKYFVSYLLLHYLRLNNKKKLSYILRVLIPYFCPLLYLSLYIYMCVCVRVCVNIKKCEKTGNQRMSLYIVEFFANIKLFFIF